MKRLPLIFQICVVFVFTVLSCGANSDPQPRKIPDLPVETNLMVAQSEYTPDWILMGYDSINSGISINTSAEGSFWHMSLELNTIPKVDLTTSFDTDNYDLEFPDVFEGRFNYKDSEGEGWRANKVDQLIRLAIDSVYEDSGKMYCAGVVDFTARGFVNPFTVRVQGNFKNVRFFEDGNEAYEYLILLQIALNNAD